MRLSTTVTILSSFIAIASAVAVDTTVDIETRELSFEEKRAEQALVEKRADGQPLDKRLVKCPSSNGCKCKKNTKQGQYCGYCSAVTAKGSGGSWEHIFECNKDGGCCDYGTSTKCAGSSWSDWCPR